MDINLDHDKIIAAVLTGIAVKLGEKGYAYLKKVYISYRLKKISRCNKSSVLLHSNRLLKNNVQSTIQWTELQIFPAQSHF